MTEFVYVFEDGPKWSREMTRDELLEVIAYQQDAIEFWKAEAHKQLGRLAALPMPRRGLLSRMLSG